MKKKLINLFIVFLIILFVIISFISYNEWPMLTGNKIVLATQPVDPFDPFRGQYMIINYEISNLKNTEEFEEGDKIYVLLEEDNENIWRFKKSLRVKPLKGDFIKGEVENAMRGNINVRYGTEQFFFERHADVPTTNITVEVSVTNSGRAIFSQLLQHGKPVEIEYENIEFTS
jgi:uncharacterized membrane-anchored protein